MRDIKFRAWNPATKDLMRSEELPNLGTFFIALEMLDDENKPYTLMQYTGLKDKNGKEIYEGDILEGKEGIFTVENWGDGVYRVVSNGMTWDWLHQLKSKGYLEYGKGNYEVIGNIYENPELVS